MKRTPGELHTEYYTGTCWYLQVIWLVDLEDSMLFQYLMDA